MLEGITAFFKENWSDIMLIIVGFSAILTYFLQVRRKESEAASLIVLQIEDLQGRMRDIASYISEGCLDGVSFYESQPLFKIDYWSQHKHLFIKKLDYFSYNLIDEFYDCASEIKEQQELMKNLQKNFFFQKQQMILNLEINSIIENLHLKNQLHTNQNELQDIIEAIMKTAPGNLAEEQKNLIQNFLLKRVNFNDKGDLKDFWVLYSNDRKDILDITDADAFTYYNPKQIVVSLEKALKKYASLGVIGCEGYNRLKKISSRKF